MHKRDTVQFVCSSHSIAQEEKVDLGDGSLPKIETSIMDILSPFFFFFEKKLVIFRRYNRK